MFQRQVAASPVGGPRLGPEPRAIARAIPMTRTPPPPAGRREERDERRSSRIDQKQRSPDRVKSDQRTIPRLRRRLLHFLAQVPFRPLPRGRTPTSESCAFPAVVQGPVPARVVISGIVMSGIVMLGTACWALTLYAPCTVEQQPLAKFNLA